MSKISIIHPTRSRPELAFKAAMNWISKCKNMEDVQYILSIDTDEPKLIEYTKLFKNFNICITKNDNRSAIDAINNAARLAVGNLMIVVSDDFDCPMDWDETLLTSLDGKEDFIVKTADGIQAFIITLPILDRKYYDRFGYIYYPGYRHMFCDSEMSVVGYMLDKTINLDIMFKHNHYIVGGMAKDAINERNDSTWEQGEQLFHSRKLINFGLSDFVKPYKEGMI